ncbi:MAG: polyprenyl synthetase family protein [Candidatus Moranbacteria bacterium]|nr:polyprenyl synthetase family protein [Candidatus Moranbacteria bacterium]
MDARKALAEFKQKVDPELDAFFDRVIAENEKVDRNITDAIKYARKITMSGGKRARAAFIYYGYLAAGGKEKKKIIEASVCIELIHSYLLMHDDIIDQDELRHGVKTTHIHYAQMARRYFRHKNAEHFGNSMAIIIGDMLNSLGNRVLFESKFAPELIIKALYRMQDIVSFTIIGETEDVMIENRGRATEKEIMRMYENKTAKYTIEGPLHLGAILAGADNRFLQTLSAYSIPAGIAFQIQDDILGVFGSVGKTGKPVGSDVRQGKQTILVAKALEKADKKQKEILKRCLGNSKLTKKDLEEFRQVIIETGSLKYAQDLAKKLILEAKEKIQKVTIAVEAKEFLLGIADYMLNREV